MNGITVPRIFAPERSRMRSRRQSHRGLQRAAQQFIWQDICEDMADRLSFVRHEPERALVLGMCHDPLRGLVDRGDSDFCHEGEQDIEAPYRVAGYDFIAMIGLLDAVNDLPGALIHIRNALIPGGLAIASFVGGASLSRLRHAMIAADADRPAPRIHPMVDPRAAPGLLQRAGWKDPVVDTRTISVRYSSLDQLVSDLRDHGLTSALANHGASLGKSALARAREAFLNNAEAGGKVTETFEIITLTGRRSMAGT